MPGSSPGRRRSPTEVRQNRMLSSRLLMTAGPDAVCPTSRHVEERARRGGRRKVLPACAVIAVCSLPLASCKTTTASTPVVVTPPPPVVVPTIPWQQKIGWIVRLEDQRLLRDPNPPPPAVIREAPATAPAVLAPRPPSDLVRLLEDRDARVRARAALAIGRVGLNEGIAALTRSLGDPDVQVRQASAFALGLIADAEARTWLATIGAWIRTITALTSARVTAVAFNFPQRGIR